MSRRRRAVMAAVLCVVFSQAIVGPHGGAWAADLLAQGEAPATPVPAAPTAPPLPAPPFPGDAGQGTGAGDAGDSDDRRSDDVVRIGSNYALKAGDDAGDLVVIMGNATVDGHVHGDLVVVMGEAQLGSGAVVDGDLVVIAGTLQVKAGAAAKHGIVVVAGSLDAPADFAPQGEQVVIGFQGLGEGVRSFLPWLTSGLLLGRPIVPGLPWVWAVVGVLFVVYLGILLIFERPVRLAADTLTATPLRALVTGLGTLLLSGPLLLLLAASVVGLLAVPFVACALLVAGLGGKVAANAWLGARLLPEGEDRNRLTLVRSFALGCVVLILAYMVPVLGGVVWASMGAVGLGASVLAFVSAYRRENPPVVPPPILPPPALPVPGDATSVGDGTHAWSEAGTAPAASWPRASSPAAVLLAMPHAAFLDRVAALALDALLVALLIGLLSGIDGEAFVPLLLAYRFAFWTWKGATVGGIVCQLRLIRVDGALVGPGEAMVRSLGSVFSFGILGLGCLWVLRDPDRQAWHDKMAGTFVVKVPRHWPV